MDVAELWRDRVSKNTDDALVYSHRYVHVAANYLSLSFRAEDTGV